METGGGIAAQAGGFPEMVERRYHGDKRRAQTFSLLPSHSSAGWNPALPLSTRCHCFTITALPSEIIITSTRNAGISHFPGSPPSRGWTRRRAQTVAALEKNIFPKKPRNVTMGVDRIRTHVLL